MSSEPHVSSHRGLPIWLTLLLVVVVLAGSVGIAVAFVKTKPKPAREPSAQAAPLVEIAPVRVGTRPVAMQLGGQVMAARKLVVMPEVGGSIVWLSGELVPGGFVKKGQPLLRIDPRDYALALQAQQAQLANQELALEVEKSRGKVAEREWELFRKEREAAGLPVPDASDPQGGAAMALRTPHLDSAKVSVSSARSSLDMARVKLSRTSIAAPFDAFVQAETVEQGQLVMPGAQLATLVGTDAFWVQVAIPVDKLAFVRLPQGKEAGSRARVWLETGTGRIEREGRVIRLLGDLDTVGRLARVLVEVEDPFLLREKTGAPRAELPAGEAGEPKSRLPLLVGSYVRVAIEGLELSGLVELPRKAMQESDTVFVLGPKDELRIVRVEVIWGGDDSVYARGPLHDGDRVVLTNLASPVEGMQLRVMKPDSKPAASGAP